MLNKVSNLVTSSMAGIIVSTIEIEIWNSIYWWGRGSGGNKGNGLGSNHRGDLCKIQTYKLVGTTVARRAANMAITISTC